MWFLIFIPARAEVLSTAKPVNPVSSALKGESRWITACAGMTA
jgi:hypothetical protein